MFMFLALSVLIGVCSASYGKGYHSIELPVKSTHKQEVIHTPSHREESSTYVDIPGGVLPVYVTFKTQSSPVYVKQEHRGTKGSYQKSDSKDEPHKLVHEVVKPIVQELREVITPFRKVVQVIEGVKEEVLTKVHKGESKGYGDEGKKYSSYDNKKYGSNEEKKYEDKKYVIYDGKKYEDKKYNNYDQKKYDRYGLAQSYAAPASAAAVAPALTTSSGYNNAPDYSSAPASTSTHDSSPAYVSAPANPSAPVYATDPVYANDAVYADPSISNIAPTSVALSYGSIPLEAFFVQN